MDSGRYGLALRFYPNRCDCALTCKMRLPGVAATVKEARYQARKNGRIAGRLLVRSHGR
jgi:hypothetical protein